MTVVTTKLRVTSLQTLAVPHHTVVEVQLTGKESIGNGSFDTVLTFHVTDKDANDIFALGQEFELMMKPIPISPARLALRESIR